MGCLVDQLHEFIQVAGPVIQDFVGVLGRGKVNDASEAVYLGIDGFLND